MHVLRSIEEALALRAELLAGEARADRRRRLHRLRAGRQHEVSGVDVVLLEPQPTPLASVLGEHRSAAWWHVCTRNEGVDVRVGTGSTSCPATERLPRRPLSDGSEIDVDVVVVGVGSVPVTGLARRFRHRTATAVCARDGVGRTSADTSGRSATSPPGSMQVSRKRVEHWTNAGEQAKMLVGALLGGGPRMAARSRTSGAISTTSRSRPSAPHRPTTTSPSSATTAASSSPTTPATASSPPSSVRA